MTPRSTVGVDVQVFTVHVKNVLVVPRISSRLGRSPRLRPGRRTA